MQQFQKGYSVLENIPEDKEPLNKEPLNVEPVQTGPKKRKHEILWYWFMLTLIVTFILLWVFILTHFHSKNEKRKESYGQESPQFVTFLTASLDLIQVVKSSKNLDSLNPANILGDLREQDIIHGDAWTAWSTIEDSGHQHICKIDNGVSDSGLDFILKRFDIVATVSSSSSSTSVYQDYSAPEGFNISGLIAIDRRKNGSGDTCNLDIFRTLRSLAWIRLESSTPLALRFTVLVIGRKYSVPLKKGGESTGKMILQNRTTFTKEQDLSEEEFNDYVY